MKTILTGLNAAQEAAVTSEADVLQILAPPGSGKTKTLTARVAYLLQHRGYQPWNVICLTFTIKSACEMRRRITGLLGDGIGKGLIIGTFHAVCRRYLVSYGHLIGLKRNFGIADSSDSLSIIRRIIKRKDLNVDPKGAQSRISRAKSKGMTSTVFAQRHATRHEIDEQEFSILYDAYEEQLQLSNLLDYDDLLLRTINLLSNHPSCVVNVQAVLIDEFQDTNTIQFDLMRLFASKSRRVTTVGDPDQSIYGWRSAEVANLGKMRQLYPEMLVVHLEENYRSSGAILISANEVIEQDHARPAKRLLPTHCPGTSPVLRKLPTSADEAAWIVSEIRRSRALTGDVLTYSDYAVLLRTASLSRLVETSFLRAGIPYRMVGGHRFYDRFEIKTLLDYLRVLGQPSNNDALARIINIPARGIGPRSISRLLEEAELGKCSLWSVLKDIGQGHSNSRVKLSNKVAVAVGRLVNFVQTSRKSMSVQDNPASPEDTLRSLLSWLDFAAVLQKLYPEDHESRWANVEELVSQSADYPIPTSDELDEGLHDALPKLQGLPQMKMSPAEDSLARFLANTALSTEIVHEDHTVDNQTSQPAQVTISTIHAAKGLEWPVVFVPSVYKGCIPHSRAEDTDEERRLLYVAMTRAQALLYLSCPLTNSHHEDTTLSPFLSDSSILRYFSKRGPSVKTNEVTDLCRILSRPCPDRRQISCTIRDLPSLEDDEWPLNGKVDSEAKKRHQASSRSEGQRFNKRLKYNNEAVFMAENYHLSSATQVTTTMLPETNVTSTFPTTFTSAKALSLANQDRDRCLEVAKSEKKSCSAGNPHGITKTTSASQNTLLSFLKPNDNVPGSITTSTSTSSTKALTKSCIPSHQPLRDLSFGSPLINSHVHQGPAKDHHPVRGTDPEHAHRPAKTLMGKVRATNHEVTNKEPPKALDTFAPGTIGRPEFKSQAQKSLGMRRGLTPWSSKKATFKVPTMLRTCPPSGE